MKKETNPGSPIPILFRIFIVLFVVTLVSCQKEVHLNLSTTPPQLVVQGAIENSQPPYVLLTTTIGFFSSIDLSTLQNSFVHGAAITISDGSRTVALKEYTIDTAGGNKFYIYSVDTTNISNFMVGEMGKIYYLSVTSNGVTYTAQTKIPYPKGLDSLWFGAPVLTRGTTPASALELFGNYTDPDTLGNYVRYFTSRNHDLYYPGGIYSDEIVNGKTIKSVDLFAGYNNSAKAQVDSVIYFYPGDTVSLKWCEIDKGVYDFWNTYQFSLQSGANPFSAPINIKSNISNGALGVWAGYGAIYYNVVAK